MPNATISSAPKRGAATERHGRWIESVLAAAVTPVLCCSLAAGAAQAPATRPASTPSGEIGVIGFKGGGGATASDGPVLVVNRIELEHMPGLKRDGGPGVEEILSKTTVTLGLLPSGLVKWPAAAVETDGLRKVSLRLTSPTEFGNKFHVSALQAIAEEMVQTCHKLGWIGVYVGIDARQLDAAALEADPEAVAKKWDPNAPLKYLLLIGAVSEVRTVGAGQPIPVDKRVNNPAHGRIRQDSPIQPVPGKNLLKKDVLDAYLDRLNRYSWRKVDVALAAGDHDGDVVLDYMVAQSKPWTAYFQLSNTGTDQTTKWRERVGFVHNNLTGRTDILSLDYVTGNFEEANAVLASYEMPVYGDRLRAKLYASWSEYKASDVGQVAQEFDGNEWAAGAELIATLMTRRNLSLDAVAGLRFKNTETDNTTSDTSGEADFWVPYVGMRYERTGETSTTSANLMLEFGFMADETTTAGSLSRESADGLGRLDVSDQWQALHGQLTHSFYLEPLLDPHGTSAPAHEILLSGRMQWTWGQRLVPQEQMITGGVYTVRGYPESIVAGDTAFVGTAEYRLHLPRLLGVQASPSKFLGQDMYWRPRPVPGARAARPDWDLVFKGFVDVGRSLNNNKLAFEENNTLASCGVGVDLLFRQNMSLRVDYGLVLHDVDLGPGQNGPDAGDGRLHVVFTIMY